MGAIRKFECAFLFVFFTLPSFALAADCLRPPASVNLFWPTHGEPSLFEEQGWSHRKTTGDGIAVYTKELDRSEIPAIRMHKDMVVDSSTLLDVIVDYELMPKIGEDSYVSESRLIATGLDPKSGMPFDDVYTLIEFPVYIPLSTREQVLRMWVLRDALGPNHHRVYWIALPRKAYEDYLDVQQRGRKNGFFGRAAKRPLYIATSVGAWDLKPISKDRVRVTYTLLTDPGGAVPAGLLRSTNERTFPGLLRNFEKQAIERSRSPSRRLDRRPPTCTLRAAKEELPDVGAAAGD